MVDCVFRHIQRFYGGTGDFPITSPVFLNRACLYCSTQGRYGKNALCNSILSLIKCLCVRMGGMKTLPTRQWAQTYSVYEGTPKDGEVRGWSPMPSEIGHRPHRRYDRAGNVLSKSSSQYDFQLIIMDYHFCTEDDKGQPYFESSVKPFASSKRLLCIQLLKWFLRPETWISTSKIIRIRNPSHHVPPNHQATRGLRMLKSLNGCFMLKANVNVTMSWLTQKPFRSSSSRRKSA